MIFPPRKCLRPCPRKQYARKGLLLVVFLWVSSGVGVGHAVSQTALDATASSQQIEQPTLMQLSLGELIAEWREIASRSPSAPGVILFTERLALVDEVLADLSQGFESQRSAALLDLLDDTLGAPTVEIQTPGEEASITAEQLLTRYQPAFATPLSADGLSSQELDVLRRLYNARLREAGQQIAERGRSVAAANPEDAAKAVSFSLVIPLLHHPDHAWSLDEVRQLPDWLQSPELLAQLEETSLRLYRPLTAWSFAKTAAGGGSNQNSAADATEYLTDTSNRLLRDSRFREAIACLRSLLSHLARDGDEAGATATRYRLAEVLADTEKPLEAVEILAPLLISKPSESLGNSGGSGASGGGRAVMLSLKYAYEAEDFEKLFALSDAYRGAEETGAYRPQVLYISWVAARRDNRPHLAKTVREAFLSGYAGHPLAADIYFAEAMEALARSDYDEAQRLLEYIVYRYPDSRLIKRVEEIQQRLTSQETAAKAP